VLERGDGGPQGNRGGLGIEQRRQFGGARHELREENGEEAIVRTGGGVRSFAEETLVDERTTSVGGFLEDDFLDDAPRFHAPEGEQAVRPRIGRFPDKLRHRSVSLYAGVSTELKVSVHDESRATIFGGEVRHFVEWLRSFAMNA